MEILGRLIRGYIVLLIGLAIHLARDPLRGDPSYEVDIVRNASTQEEADLIALAEVECPRYDEVAAVFDRAAPPESSECLWWYSDYGTRIPYALTSEAVRYYAETVARYEEEEANVAVSFSYEAHVEDGVPDPRTPEVLRQVVRIHADFKYACGGCCGQFFAKDRVVYFDESGAIVLVEGDGVTDFFVSK